MKDATEENLRGYLKDKLGFDNDSITDLGRIRIRRVMERKPKYKDEVVVTFEEKATRDAVKAQAHRLANYRDEAGMRLHVPDHLQKVFRTLMNLSFELKKKHTELRRSVKFDEENLSMFMDIQLKSGGSWKRIGGEQAMKTAFERRQDEGRTETIGVEELDELLGSEESG